MVAKGIVACCYGCMRCEERVSSNDLARLFKGQSIGDQFAAALQVQKGRMALVEMPGGGGDAQGTQRAYPADTEQDLLRDACLLISTIQTCCQFAVTGVIMWDVGVHQVQCNTSHLDLPYPGIHTPARQIDTDEHLCTLLVLTATTSDLPYT